MRSWKHKAVVILAAAFGLSTLLSGCLSSRTVEEANINGEWLVVEKPDGWTDLKYVFKGDQMDIYHLIEGKTVHMSTWSLSVFPGSSTEGRIIATCTSDYYGKPPVKGQRINMIYKRSGEALSISFAVEAANIGSQTYKLGFSLSK